MRRGKRAASAGVAAASKTARGKRRNVPGPSTSSDPGPSTSSDSGPSTSRQENTAGVLQQIMHRLNTIGEGMAELRGQQAALQAEQVIMRDNMEYTQEARASVILDGATAAPIHLSTTSPAAGMGLVGTAAVARLVNILTNGSVSVTKPQSGAGANAHPSSS